MRGCPNGASKETIEGGIWSILRFVLELWFDGASCWDIRDYGVQWNHWERSLEVG